MLDIRFLRENPEVVKQNIRNKFQDSKLPLVDEVMELDKRNREIKQEVEALRAERNKISKMIGGLMKEGKREEAEEAKKQLGLDIDKKKMKLDVPIKALGNYIIQIKLHKDVTAELTVKVVEK